jgi:hypothetical protein
MDNDMYRALEQAGKRVYPGATMLPSMLSGYTDMALLRAKGIQSYGIGPAMSVTDKTNYGPHSDVERMLETSLYRLVAFTWDVVANVAGHKN